MLKVGQILDGKYQILREIGRGGMSTVYLAMDARVNKQWAVKVVNKKENTHKNKIILDSMLREAELMRSLDHPALPRVVDIIDDDELLVIVMDYIEGSTLDKVLLSDGLLTESEVVDWTKQIADILAYLHGRFPPVIYRDVKPSNFILRPDGQITIVDFGISRTYSPQKMADTTVLGTKGYAPPEQYTGQTDQRSDIYALGMTMHHLLTGIDPRNGLPYQPVRHWRPNLSEAIEAIVDKCVHPNPDARFQNCAELISVLEDPRKELREYRKKRGLNLWDRLHNTPLPLPRSPEVSREELDTLVESLSAIDDIGAVSVFRQTLRFIDLTVLDKVDPTGLRYLHIVGTPNADLLDRLFSYGIRSGGYRSPDGSWMLLLGVDKHRIQNFINACPRELETLHVRMTELEQLDFPSFPNMKTLRIFRNHRLSKISGHYASSNLEYLEISDSPVPGSLYLKNCPKLRHLDISRTEIFRIFSLFQLEALTHLNAADSRLTDASFLSGASVLEHADFTNCPVSELPPMGKLRCLKTLSLAGTHIRELCDLTPLESLVKLDCSGSQVASIADAALPQSLQNLSFRGTRISRIPEDVRAMNRLTCLDLSELRLKELPDWLPEIASEFITGDRFAVPRPGQVSGPNETFSQDPYRMALLHDETGILGDSTGFLEEEHTFLLAETAPLELPEDVTEPLDLQDDIPVSLFDSWCEVKLINTRVEGVDMSIFSQPMHMILQWFEVRKQQPMLPEQEAPLNEIKVVFLGDGEAGKSLVVARLLNDGAHPDDFDGNATPGISIRDLQYDLDGRRVQVHFWDFGGQEILHSMHRMFLTQRTLYVILLNARDDTQDDRARYWLHNVKSFADGAPVILVLNKLDQNPKASVNEHELREMYPGLTEVVSMSALLNDRETFNSTFTAALKRQISAFETLESPFLPSWNRLKNRLRNMTKPYILSPEYHQISEECGVEANEETRTALLNWFTDLGVSFCYSGSAKLEDYVILRPDWITNAVYILMYNPIKELNNGIVSHDAIHRMLHPPASMRSSIKSVLPNVMYTAQDTEYVLNVIRRFRLSYLIRDNAEFIPMLCRRDTMDIAQDYASDPQTMEFHILYEYLPNNLLHRLMVDMRRDLDVEYVWLTGARFSQNSTGLSAVVKAEGNVLKLYVRSTELRYPADYYLDILKDMIEQIGAEMGLKIEERLIAYKADGITECFDYDMLVGTLREGASTFYSKRRGRLLQIEKILRQSDHHVDLDRQALIYAIIRACAQMQTNSLYWGTSENTRNTFVRDSLITAGYQIADQSLAGLSAGGKQPGELDLLIRNKQGIPWTIYEGLLLNGAGGSQLKYWDDHLAKLLDNYNENGLQFLVLVSYVTCSKERFPEICKTFTDHIRSFNPRQYAFQSMVPVDLRSARFEMPHYLFARKCVYDCGGFQTSVYHFFVRMPQKPD